MIAKVFNLSCLPLVRAKKITFPRKLFRQAVVYSELNGRYAPQKVKYHENTISVISFKILLAKKFFYERHCFEYCYYGMCAKKV